MGVPTFRMFYLSLALGVSEGESSEMRLNGLIDLGCLKEFYLCELNLVRFCAEPVRCFLKF